MSSVEAVLQFLNQLVIKSPKVQIINNHRGRGLVATTFIKKDEHIFTSTPLVGWPKKQTKPIRLDKNCNHCFISNNNISTCQVCQMDKLFMSNMKKYHKLVKTYSSTSESSSTTTTTTSESSRYEAMVNKLAYRLCKEIQDGYENTNYILNLLSAPEIPEEIKEGLIDEYDFLKQQLIEHGLQNEMEKFLTLDWYSRSLGVLHLNAIGTPLPTSGSALYDDISYINHSCSPTVGLLFKGMTATVVSLKDLQEGDELFINYVEMEAEKNNWNHDEIQEKLMFNYGFDCSQTCSCGKMKPNA